MDAFILKMKNDVYNTFPTSGVKQKFADKIEKIYVDVSGSGISNNPAKTELYIAHDMAASTIETHLGTAGFFL